MKYLKLLFAVPVLASSACNNSPESPEEVLLAFDEYMSHGACESALELCTQQGQGMVYAHMDQDCFSFDSNIDSVSCRINDNTADCDCFEKGFSFPSSIMPVQLKKENGVWKVHANWFGTNTFTNF